MKIILLLILEFKNKFSPLFQTLNCAYYIIKNLPVGLTTLQQLNLNHMPNLNSIGENAFSSILNLKVLQMSRCPNLKHINKLAFADPKLLNGPWTLEEVRINFNFQFHKI